jgi:hypothetical protein
LYGLVNNIDQLVYTYHPTIVEYKTLDMSKIESMLNELNTLIREAFS